MLSQLRIYADTMINGHLNTVSRREIGMQIKDHQRQRVVWLSKITKSAGRCWRPNFTKVLRQLYSAEGGRERGLWLRDGWS